MRTLTILAALLALGGCQSMSKGPSASAQLESSQGGRVVGKVTFQQAEGGGTNVRAEVTGLPPNRQFGFHVHDKGDCSAPDFMSAAGHFNPETKPHGDHKTTESHAGDLPNLMSDGQGMAVLAYTSSKLTVVAGPHSVVGRAVVVHENPDDYRSQPAGNSGPRIACGVIKG